MDMVKRHLKYLQYIIKHKWYVFIECCKLGIPWRGIVHDLSKFSSVEWMPYTLSFYGPWKYNERPGWLRESFDRAWLHHQHCNPHHWQHWLLVQDDEATLVLPMPDAVQREMLADWRGASRAQTGKDNTTEWYSKHKQKIQLDNVTREWIESQLEGL